MSVDLKYYFHLKKVSFIHHTKALSCYAGHFTTEQWKNTIYPVPFTPQTSCTITDAKYCLVNLIFDLNVLFRIEFLF